MPDALWVREWADMGRWRLAALRKAPLTLSFVGALWIVGVGTSSVVHGPAAALAGSVGVGVGPLAHGHWWAPLTSLLWCGDLAGYVATTVLIVAVCGPAEFQLGTVRAGCAFLASHIAGVLAGVGLVALGSLAGEWWSASIADATTVGPSTAVVGLALALSWRCSPLWRRRLRLVLLVTLVMLVLYSGHLQDVLRLASGLAGLLLGRRLVGRDRIRHIAPPSRPEARLLLALITCASAVGPLIAVVSGTPVGPLSGLRYVFLPSIPDEAQINDVCSDRTQAAFCHELQTQAGAHGFASAFASLIPVLVLLVLAEGLRRGRRFAWWGAAAVNVIMMVFGAVSLEVVPALATTISQGPQSYGDFELLVGVLASALGPMAVVILLVWHRRAFDVAAPRGTYRDLVALAGVALAMLSLLYVGGGRLVADEFHPVGSAARLLSDLPWRLIPPGYLEGGPARLVPNGGIARLLSDWIGVLFWTAVLVGAWTTFRRSRAGTDAGDATRAKGLLIRHGGSQLSYMTTWRGNSYWFSPDGRVAVTYRLVGSVAVTVGDPIGDPAGFGAAVRGFAQFCGTNGWTPCLYSVTEELATTLGGAGWKLIQVAEDTRLPLADLQFTGRRWQDVRTAMNKARRDGVSAEWHSYRHAPPAITDQIKAISAECVLDKGLPEMGFTLGGLHELGDDAVRCLLAVGAQGDVQAVTSWLPVYRDAAIVGWTLDMMRRRPASCNGLMEFLIASAAMRFKQEGAEFLSLSGAPLARHRRRPETSALQRLLDWFGRVIEPIYGFGSVSAFKAKFQPVYRPLFLAYPESVALPSIGGAIARAYLPALTLTQALRLLYRAVRGNRRRARPEPLPVALVADQLVIPSQRQRPGPGPLARRDGGRVDVRT
jgi:phosphatidylglycerol lysyltransferase